MKYSPNGRYLAASCQSIKRPQIYVWAVGGDGKDLERTSRLTYQQAEVLEGHNYSVQTLQFTPDSDHLVSIGDHNDQGIFVWSLLGTGEKKLVSVKETAGLTKIGFDSDGKYLVSAGYSHLKVWSLDKLKQKEPSGTSVDLKKFQQKIIVGVVVHADLCHCLTSGGHIYSYSITEKKLKQWMDIQVKRAFSMAADVEK